MDRKEAIEWLEDIKSDVCTDQLWCWELKKEALNMAIKAIEEGD